MSFCAVPKEILIKMGDKPFIVTANGVDDMFLCNKFPLYGPVVLTHGEFVAYRVSPNAQSSDWLKLYESIVSNYTYLQKLYFNQNCSDLLRLLDCEYASKQRYLGQIYFRLSQKAEARRHFLGALWRSRSTISMAKSLALWVLSFMPPPFTLRGKKRYRG
jgi:hypothetical protein